jgi:hypothetical protein
VTTPNLGEAPIRTEAEPAQIDSDSVVAVAPASTALEGLKTPDRNEADLVRAPLSGSVELSQLHAYPHPHPPPAVGNGKNLKGRPRGQPALLAILQANATNHRNEGFRQRRDRLPPAPSCPRLRLRLPDSPFNFQ